MLFSSFPGDPAAPSELVDILVQTNLYDMAFTVLLKLWKNSGLKRCAIWKRVG